MFGFQTRWFKPSKRSHTLEIDGRGLSCDHPCGCTALHLALSCSREVIMVVLDCVPASCFADCTVRGSVLLV